MSFNIAMSGLNTTSQELNTISNNIANVSTVGFKSSRAEFSALMNGGMGGGVELASLSQSFNDGAFNMTGRTTDLAIGGNGMFVLQGEDGAYTYSRAGMFQQDKDNFLVNSAGLRLQGYTTDSSGNLQTGSVGDIQVSTGSVAAKATDRVDFAANLDAGASEIVDENGDRIPFDPEDSDSFNSSYTTTVYDSLGNEHTLTQYFVKTGDNEWEVHYAMNGEVMEDESGQALEFDDNGKLVEPTGNISLSFAPEGAAEMNIALSMSGTTQYGSEFAVSTNRSNGYTAGELTGITIDDSGMVFANYSNGEQMMQGQIVLADFPNTGGLMQVGNTGWSATQASGQPLIGVPGTGTLGGLYSGYIEESNVDLTGELVGLMTAQRNYQANAQSLSTQQQLAQVLFNM
ncbi:flagellar basal body protein FlgE [Photobacterium sp. ZSDE20]|uniref:Flagellar hook protein FlgE n=1 Tax=Photobacterium pectinilyticum TaxID=2906793 RepID=A0ABT1MY49_9GAMM|nr:flagellar hook protein FlgE [Photobacterium sp. ZSDE20]MCQ1057427.1 flagellar basal body protein FlgE [Photobacterium sp. ZSDE20]MDD1821624.1 flagellar basal body protein FlgE [Photobacterium sp. ZSDE20]